MSASSGAAAASANATITVAVISPSFPYCPSCPSRPSSLRDRSCYAVRLAVGSETVMRIVVPKEMAPREHRVALVPESCKKLIQLGYEIAVEAGAGDAAGFDDSQYTAVGATIESTPEGLIGSADLVLKVTAPTTGAARDEVAMMRPK